MSRILRYRNSIENYYKNKSCFIDIGENYKKCLSEIKSDYFVPIILLTVMKNISSKYGFSLPGYCIASGIENLYLMYIINENIQYYNTLYTKTTISNLQMVVHNNIFKSVSQNIVMIKEHITKEKIIAMSCYVNNYITSKLEYIISYNLKCPGNIWKQNDVVKYKFPETLTSKKLYSLKVFSKSELLNYIENILGNICKITLVSGWILGNGDEKTIPQIEKIANYMAQLIKVSYDFDNIEEDLVKASDHTFNTVITIGYQESFELFQSSREKFIEGCMLYGFYSNTIKEMVDVLEKRMDCFIDNTTKTPSNCDVSISSIK